jgi:hypothetical protein
MAIRRLMSSGSRGPAEDRLVDLLAAAEALFIHGAVTDGPGTRKL